jgi:PPOX class probable F420-dependent enzyme
LWRFPVHAAGETFAAMEKGLTVLQAEVRAFLAERRFASLATINTDGAPQQSVMWYMLDGDTVVMNTRRGRVKDRNLLTDNRASICVEDGYRYVTISGRIAMNDDQSVAQADIKALATRYDGPEEAERIHAATFSKQQRVTLRLSIERVDAHGFDAS